MFEDGDNLECRRRGTGPSIFVGVDFERTELKLLLLALAIFGFG